MDGHPSTALSFRSIAHVNEKGGRFGGTEEYVDSLSRCLTEFGVRSHLLCGMTVGEMPATLESTHLIAGLASRRPLPSTSRRVAEVIDEIAPDVVYLHNLFDPGIVDALDRPGRHGRLVWYVHDHYPTCLTELRLRFGQACSHLLGPSCLGAVRRGECTRRLTSLPLGENELADHAALLAGCNRVDAVVVVSPYMRELLVGHLPHLAARIRLLPRPVRPGAGRREQHAAPGTPLTVTFAGRITPEKGLDVVLAALAELPVGFRVQLNVAGVVEHPDYWQRCRELAAEALSASPSLSITYLGHLRYAEIDALFAASDVVVVPSCWPEPLGAVVPEALRAGAVVVASAVGGLGTYIEDGHTGLLVEPWDTTAWAAALVALAAEPSWAQKLGEAGAKAVAGLTADAHVRALDELIRRLTPGL